MLRLMGMTYLDFGYANPRKRENMHENVSRHIQNIGVLKIIVEIHASFGFLLVLNGNIKFLK